jgi:hypothetical protein
MRVKPKTMQKVYLLLRDNKQTGPHSLEELLQLGLRPYDLVWVEGRSCGWSYPSEINALKPYAGEVPAAPAPTESTESMPSTPPTYTPSDTTTSSSPKSIAPPKSIFVSLPGKVQPAAAPAKQAPPASDWDRRVEELRQRAQAYTPAAAPLEEETPELNTNYARSLNEVEEQYTDWVYRQKTKKKPLLSGRQLSTLAIGVILLGGGYLAGSSLLGAKPKQSAQPSSQSRSLSVQQPSGQETSTSTTEVAGAPVVYEEEPSEKEPQTKTPLYTTTIPHKEVKNHTQPLTTKGAVARSKPPVQPRTESTGKVERLPPIDDPTVLKERKPAADEPAASVPKARKKSLAEKIDGFIEKIASKGPSGREVKEEPPTTSPEPGTGERRSTRRGEEGAPAIDPAELARQVEVVANQSDNWMMGVKDLKLIVRNNSSIPIKTAAIEVSYYSENDNLLERKTVYVSGIPAKGRKTVAAPDQRLADHVDLRVLSVSADEEAYARQ